jgi:hypothetical protein
MRASITWLLPPRKARHVPNATVHRDTFCHVLRQGGVDVSVDGDTYTLAKDGVPIQTYVLPEHVERKMLFRFEHRFKIPISLVFSSRDDPETWK